MTFFNNKFQCSFLSLNLEIIKLFPYIIRSNILCPSFRQFHNYEKFGNFSPMQLIDHIQILIESWKCPLSLNHILTCGTIVVVVISRRSFSHTKGDDFYRVFVKLWARYPLFMWVTYYLLQWPCHWHSNLSIFFFHMRWLRNDSKYNTISWN